MLANNKIFCNTPWYEFHIYWDGSYGICCQEDHRLHTDNQKYNIANMTIMEWFNSDIVKQFRLGVLGDRKVSPCSRCYYEEEHNTNSRRLNSNQKSVIFTKTAFDESFKQSPGYAHFEHSLVSHGSTNTYPVDIHIDLGNFCNLACKTCGPHASSTIASQQVKWGIKEAKQYVGTDWTKNEDVWQNFKKQLLDIPNLNNIHFMGGETLLTPRFEDLVDTMIENKRFDICFSFVTNGTVFKPSLMSKLTKFKRVGIEVSIETLDSKNSYIRQGTNTQEVLENISRYQTYCNGTSITVTLRPVLSLLSIGGYLSLLEFTLNNKFLIKSNVCIRPRFLSIEILPDNVKKHYLAQYLEFVKQFDNIETDSDYNTSDPNNYIKIVKEQALTCLELLRTPTPADHDQQLSALVDHCRQWDSVYKLNARELYPELEEVWNQYGY